MSNQAVRLPAQHKKISRFQEIVHRLRKNVGAMIGAVIVLLVILVALTCDLWIDYDTEVIAINGSQMLQHPSAQHIMGTDRYGRDVFLRLVWGTRYSLAVGIISTLIAAAIGTTVGLLAGYFGGWIENLLLRATDIFASVPTILMGIVIVSALGASTFSLMLAVGICMATPFVRMIRSVTLTIRNQEYVQAARALGMPGWRIVFLHILPNCVSQLIVQISLRVGHAIITAASLSFLGLGVPLPAPEWGAMLSEARNYIRGYSYLCLYPGLAIMIVVLAFNMFGDGLRDAMDPKLKK